MVAHSTQPSDGKKKKKCKKKLQIGPALALSEMRLVVGSLAE
jgi:hypothetical protein